MKQIFLTLAIVGLVACHNEPEVHIMGTQFDFAQPEGVDDSLVYGEYEPNPIDTLQNVSDLLFYLEGIPSFEEIE